MKTKERREYYKSKSHYYENKGLSSFKNHFRICEHAIVRFRERKVKLPIDYNKLRPIKTSEINSKIFNEPISKYTQTKDKNKTIVYWTDGKFIFISYSKKAGHYVIVTVL